MLNLAISSAICKNPTVHAVPSLIAPKCLMHPPIGPSSRKTVILKLFEIYVCVCVVLPREKRSDDDAIVLGIVLGSYL